MTNRNVRGTWGCVIPQRWLRIGVVAFCMMFYGPSAALGALSDLRTRAPISWSGAPTNYSLMELSDQVLSQSQTNFADLRIYSEEEEIPYALLSPQDLNPRRSGEKVPLLNLGNDGGGNLVFELANPQTRYVQGIRLHSLDQQFIRRVQVEGSRNQRDWVRLQSDSIIFDLQEASKNRYTEIDLPTANFDYLRLTVFKEGQGQFRPEGAELILASPVLTKAKLKERPFTLEQQVSKDNIQEFIIDLRESLPTEELELYTEMENFNRRIELLASENNKDWRLLVQGEIYVYRLDHLTAKHLVVKHEGKQRYLKLRIHNQDNALLKINKLKVRGLNSVLVFPTVAEKRYYLYWNNDQLEGPNYDLQRFKGNLDYGKLNWATLGAAEENKSFKFVDTRPWTEQNAWLLQALLVMVVGALLLIIVLSLRKIGKDKT